MSKTTGKANGTIAKRELETLPKDLIYRCQEKAWFDEPVMLEWVEKVLKPYVANVPHGIVPIIFLDDFSVHKTGSVVRAIQDLGVEVEFIPPTKRSATLARSKKKHLISSSLFVLASKVYIVRPTTSLTWIRRQSTMQCVVGERSTASERAQSTCVPRKDQLIASESPSLSVSLHLGTRSSQWWFLKVSRQIMIENIEMCTNHAYR